MKPLYESFEDDIEFYRKKSEHTPPHMHNFIECVYILSGTLELGVGQELYHMEKGDFAIMFPGQIHHSQVFDAERGQSMYLIASPNYAELYRNLLLNYIPEQPIISADKLHKDVYYCMNGIYEEIKSEQPDFDFGTHAIYQSYIHLILARILPLLSLKERNNKDDGDLIYRTVTYIAKHFTEPVTLNSMAKDMYVSPYALSRIFSGTFHTNFNRYLNETRLEYALNLLRYTDQTITEVYENSGFESQRTFNRFFSERMHMSPHVYRNQIKNELDIDYYAHQKRER